MSVKMPPCTRLAAPIISHPCLPPVRAAQTTAGEWRIDGAPGVFFLSLGRTILTVMPQAATELARGGLGAEIIVALRRIGKRKTVGDEHSAKIGAICVVTDRRRHRRALTGRHAAGNLIVGGEPRAERAARLIAARARRGRVDGGTEIAGGRRAHTEEPHL